MHFYQMRFGVTAKHLIISYFKLCFNCRSFERLTDTNTHVTSLCDMTQGRSFILGNLFIVCLPVEVLEMEKLLIKCSY